MTMDCGNGSQSEELHSKKFNGDEGAKPDPFTETTCPSVSVPPGVTTKVAVAALAVALAGALAASAPPTHAIASAIPSTRCCRIRPPPPVPADWHLSGVAAGPHGAA
ncbi:MAG: hypothetical protein ACXVJA_19425, partial [Acidimicrobiia bacterium]